MTESDVPEDRPTAPAPAEPAPGTPLEGMAFAVPETEPAHPTAPPVPRPSVAPRRSGPLTRMGPWAPVAGALLGTVLGGVAVLLLVGTADEFAQRLALVLLVGTADECAQRLALVLLVVGMGLLGASGPLLADEVRLVRRGAREAAVRPAWAETTAALLNGLTPARLLLLVSGFVLFLSAYVARG